MLKWHIEMVKYAINLSDYLICLQSKVDYGVANQKLTLLVFEQKVLKHAYVHLYLLHCKSLVIEKSKICLPSKLMAQK